MDMSIFLYKVELRVEPIAIDTHLKEASGATTSMRNIAFRSVTLWSGAIC